jgi:hypothetical protein
VGNSFPDRIFDILIVVCDRYRAEGGLLVGSQRPSQAVEAQMHLLLLLLLLGKEYNASGCIVERIYWRWPTLFRPVVFYFGSKIPFPNHMT